MKKYILPVLAVLAAIPALACTNMLVGKKASVNGATMISYNADSHQLYGELYYTAAADHQPGEMRQVIDWDSQKPIGQIPQPAHSYRVVGNVNEWQVTIAESTWGGDYALVDTTAMIDYGSLIYITLERAKTAREAIMIMTQLVEEYGYYSSGETFSIGDPNEIWVMDLVGKGTPGQQIGETQAIGQKGAVWVARLIPDDCVACHANQARIHTFPQKGRKIAKVKSMINYDGSGLTTKNYKRYEVGDSCYFSTDLISFARECGKYDAKGTDENFDFAKAFGDADFGAFRACDGRVWSWFNSVASGMDKYFPFVDMQGKPTATGYVNEKGEDVPVLPLYVKPDRLLSHRDVQQGLADHYEGTPWDMTQDVGGGPFHSPYRWRPMTWEVDGVEYTHERAIGTQQTGFTFVAEMRGWLPREVGAKTWFGVDDAASALYVPIYNNISKTPRCVSVGNGDMLTFSWTSLFWMTSWVAQQRYTTWDLMSPDIEAVRKELFDRWDQQEKEIDAEAVALVEAGKLQEATDYLTNYSCAEADNATLRYQDLAIYLLVKYLDGNVKVEKDGKFERTQWGLPESPKHPKYSDDFYRAIVNQKGESIKVKK